MIKNTFGDNSMSEIKRKVCYQHFKTACGFLESALCSGSH